MTQDSDQEREDVDRFIMARVDSVPHLEALLLLWRERPRAWSVEDLAKRLWVKADVAKGILQDLMRDQLISAGASPNSYYYQLGSEKDELLEAVNNSYRKEIIRISTMIHSKPSRAVRDFARAFRLKKDE